MGLSKLKNRESFLKIKNPEEFMLFKKENPNVKLDDVMAEHLHKIAIEFSNGETIETHSDPREAFIKK